MEPSEFKGVAGRYHFESEAYWPPAPQPPEHAPNVLIVLLDDVGFAQIGCFGSDIDTPRMNRLADDGLRFTNFHTTALCSPTRACVLTGRNHHSAGMGRIIELATGFPGYDARIPKSVGFLPAMLTPHGYAAWAVGKWHLTPEDECNLAARRDRWPLARGFERFYGFFSGETHQNAASLIHDSHQIVPPKTVEEGYHFTEDMVDQAITNLTDLRHVDDQKPWFMYFTPGACHSPHHAPQEFLDKYKGQFDEGWDVWRERTIARQKESGILPDHTVLSERPEWVPAWDTLPDNAKAVYAKYMEAFAAFLDHTDTQLGRLVDFIAELGELDNTMILLMSDNGASSEGGPIGSLNDVRNWNAIGHSLEEAFDRIDEIGGPRIHNNYPWGWTVAGNTPFRRWKRETHEGGVADPLIVHWPARIGASAGELRHQYVHAIDIAPTILDAIGVDLPDEIDGVPQRPIEGSSFLDVLTDKDAPEFHLTQYYEMFGTRALYHEGWKAVVYHEIQAEEPGLDQVGWELYNLIDDPSETNDLAESEPEKLQELVERWWVEAARYQVLPLDNRPFSEFVLERPHPYPARPRYVYRPGTAMVPEAVAVNVKNRPHTISATIDVPEGGADGVIISQGSVLGGWTFYVHEGTLRYVHNLSGIEQHLVSSDVVIPPGSHEVEFRYAKDKSEPKRADLLLDGEVVGSAVIPQFTWNRISLTGVGLTCGWSFAPSPSDDYTAPNPYTGGLSPVVIEAEGEPVVDAIAEAMDALSTQ